MYVGVKNEVAHYLSLYIIKDPLPYPYSIEPSLRAVELFQWFFAKPN